MRDSFLQAPDSQISAATKETIKTWDDTPTYRQIKTTLNHAVHTGGASSFAIKALEIFLALAKAEGE